MAQQTPIRQHCRCVWLCSRDWLTARSVLRCYFAQVGETETERGGCIGREGEGERCSIDRLLVCSTTAR